MEKDIERYKASELDRYGERHVHIKEEEHGHTGKRVTCAYMKERDMGIQDMGIEDMGIQDMGIEDMGIQDMGIQEEG
jgi:hypothetical protein